MTEGREMRDESSWSDWEALLSAESAWGETESSYTAIVSSLAEIVAQPVDWLWGNVVARGTVTLLTGAPGIGKSFVALDIAAAVTRGDREKGDRHLEASEPVPFFPGDIDAGFDEPRALPTKRSAVAPGDREDADEIIENKMVTGTGGRPQKVEQLKVVSRKTRWTAEACETSQSPICPEDVLLISPDFELAHVVRPRLEAAGADVARVHVLRGIQSRNPESNDDSHGPLDDALQSLQPEIAQRKAAGSPLSLIVIDPFPLEQFDSRYGAAELQRTIKLLAEIAARSEIAILVVANSPQQPRGNLANQLAVLDSAFHSAWRVFSDLDRSERRLLLPIKANLSEKSPGRTFNLRDGRVWWHADPVWLTAEQFQADLRERSRTTLFEQEWSELSRVTNWLRDYLQDRSVNFKEIKNLAAFNGIAHSTLRRAFCGLKGVSSRVPGTNGWVWKLPDEGEEGRSGGGEE